MAHYRTMLTSDNFMAADLWDEADKKYRDAVVQIVTVKKGEVVGEKGRKKGMPFVTMKNARGNALSKPLGLNATNCATLTSIAGSPDTDRWVGLWVTLYVTKTDAGAEKRDCIRIRPEAAGPPAGPVGGGAP